MAKNKAITGLRCDFVKARFVFFKSAFSFFKSFERIIFIKTTIFFC